MHYRIRVALWRSRQRQRRLSDHLFKEGEFKGDSIHFVARSVHGIWFEFQGTVGHGIVTDPNKEGYRVIKGGLTQYTEGDKDQPTADPANWL